MKKISIYFILGLVFIMLSRYASVGQIDCYTQYGQCPEKYYLELQKYLGKSLFWTNPKLSFSEIKTVKKYLRLPRTLVISISLRKPIGALSTSILSAQAVVDESGNVLSQVQSTALPLLLVSELPNVPNTIEKSQALALTILDRVSSLSTNRITGSLNGNRLEIDLTPITKIIIDINKPVAEWYPSLQVILNRSKITAKYHKVIDLRFSRPIITD